MRAKTLVDREIEVRSTDTSNTVFYPLTNWRSSTGIVDGTVSTVLRLQNEIGTIQVKAGIQFALVTSDDPDVHVAIGTQRVNNGTYFENVTLSSLSPAPNTYYLYRLGLAIHSANDENSSGRVKLTVTTNATGAHVGSTT